MFKVAHEHRAEVLLRVLQAQEHCDVPYRRNVCIWCSVWAVLLLQNVNSISMNQQNIRNKVISNRNTHKTTVIMDLLMEMSLPEGHRHLTYISARNKNSTFANSIFVAVLQNKATTNNNNTYIHKYMHVYFYLCILSTLDVLVLIISYIEHLIFQNYCFIYDNTMKYSFMYISLYMAT